MKKSLFLMISNLCGHKYILSMNNKLKIWIFLCIHWPHLASANDTW